MIVVKIGTGIGAGIISNGRIHRGAQGSAGDVGHIQVVDDTSIICRCGNVGLPRGARGWRGNRRATERRQPGRDAASGSVAALDQHGRVTATDVARAASFGDPVSVALLQSAGRRVGLMLASVVNLFNPSLVVVGGGVAQSGDQLLAAIRETVYRRSLPLATRELIIHRSSLGALAGVIGASSMVVEQLFSREAMARLAEPRRAGSRPRRGDRRDRLIGQPGDDEVAEVARLGILDDELQAAVGQDLALDDDLAVDDSRA